jgi:superoxide dismutase, Fe-Mn family
MYNPVKLPYSYSDLEPYIDAETMYVHYNNHYLGYLNKLNELVSSTIPIKYLMKNINNYSNDVRNNAGGYYNHSLFWNMLTPSSNKKIPIAVNNLINKDFGSYKNFVSKIQETAKKRFGSGWVWWILYPNGVSAIVETPYQDNPLMFTECKILLGIDVWEHAYYLEYQSNREAYIDNILNIINWDYVNSIISKNPQ